MEMGTKLRSHWSSRLIPSAALRKVCSDGSDGTTRSTRPIWFKEVKYRPSSNISNSKWIRQVLPRSLKSFPRSRNCGSCCSPFPRQKKQLEVESFGGRCWNGYLILFMHFSLSNWSLSSRLVVVRCGWISCACASRHAVEAPNHQLMKYLDFMPHTSLYCISEAKVPSNYPCWLFLLGSVLRPIDLGWSKRW